MYRRLISLDIMTRNSEEREHTTWGSLQSTQNNSSDVNSRNKIFGRIHTFGDKRSQNAGRWVWGRSGMRGKARGIRTLDRSQRERGLVYTASQRCERVI